MKKLFSLLTAILFVGSMMAKEYTYNSFTTSFVKGTTNGTDINEGLPAKMSTLASSGASNFASFTSTNCYYKADGAGIRISKSGGAGNVTFTLSDALKDSTIYAIVVYASKVSGNTKAVLNITPTGPAENGYTTVTNISNGTLPAYNTSSPATTSLNTYKLDTIKVNGKKINTLDFASVSKGYTMLHAITIVTQTEILTTEPTVTPDPTSWDFGDVEQNAIGSDDTKHILKNISLTGSNLTDNIQLDVATTGGGSIFFINSYQSSIELTPEEGVIDYELVAIAATSTSGEFTGTITVSSLKETPEFTPVVINLSINVVAPVAVTGVALDESAITLQVGETQTLEATISPNNATNKNVTWESNATGVATVDANGKVTAVAAGEATITCKSAADNTKTATCTVTVTPLTTCAEVYEKNQDDVVKLNDVVITYANKKYVYVKDATGSMLLYLPANTSWTAGKTLSGVVAALDIYNGLHELKPTASQVSAVTATDGEAPAPEELKAAPTSADINKYVTLKGVSFKTASFTDNDITAQIGEEEFAVRNQFYFSFSFDTAKKYDIVGVGSIYNTTLRLNLISATEQTSTGFDNIESSAKAVKVLRNGVLYIEKAGKTYNAQGQLVK